ncbi:MarR family transcriptional regulator [Micromonospora sp. NPDC050495]|uniref:MarR family transcriptional regulator n=1 Tax=Micromonospora sp. NPDC050495 TaxID=3154936 RepID=UPI0033D19BED
MTDLGQGNVHELADRSGKARSTTDKAIKTLADAGVIVAVHTDADSAEGTPTRWTLATPATDVVPDDVAGPGDAHTAGADETEQPADPDPVDAAPATGDTEPADHPDTDTDGDAHQETAEAANESDRIDASDKACDDADNSDEGREAPTVTVVQPTRPGDRKVMAIKGVLADYGDDGATLDVVVAESGIGHVTAARLLTVMEQADAARRRPDLPDRWIPGPTKASEVDPNPQPPRCPLCLHLIRGAATTPNVTATILPLIRSDGTLHVVGPDEKTHVVTLPTRPGPRTSGNAGSGGRRSDVTVNADGSQPFGRGVLEKLTLDVLAAAPGAAMTPQDIATAIGGQLGRAVSSGAVRNNCTKAAAAGRIVLVSDAPLTFAYPAPADSGTAVEQS